MEYKVFPAQHEPDSFSLEFITDEGCDMHHCAETIICNAAGWKCDWSLNEITDSIPDCVAFSELEYWINEIKKDLNGHPNRDRHYADLDNLLNAGHRLFRDEDVRNAG